MSEKYVYLITVHPSEKRYVGQTKNMDHRFNDHLAELNSPVHNELKRLGEGAYIEMIELWRGPSEESDDMERYYIDEYGCMGECGLNSTTGGIKGYSWTPEIREQIAEYQRSKWEDPAFREKCIAGQCAAWAGNEARREHISKVHKEKFKDVLYKEMVHRAGLKARGHPVEMYDLETGSVIAIFAGVNVAAEITGACQQHISKCCAGELKKHAGFGWRFAEGKISDELINSMEDGSFRDSIRSIFDEKTRCLEKDKLVVMVDPETGEALKIFKNMHSAADYVNGSHQHISKCVSGVPHHLTHKGYGWRRATDEEAKIYLNEGE